MNERTRSDTAETTVREWLEQSGFDAEPFSKTERRTTKTPDFRVYQSGELRFFCEVKSVQGDDLLSQRLAAARLGEIVIVERGDPAFNRLTADVHEAAKQFDAVNPDRVHPNVLAFVNYESICDVGDLYAILTGNFFADNGSRHPIYKQYSEGRMRTDAARIDLFVWFQVGEPEPRFVYGPPPQHAPHLCSLLGHDPATIKRL